MIRFENSLDFARRCDAADPLRPLREEFYFPRLRRPAAVYFTGNSLGFATARHAGLPRRRARRLGQPRRRRPLPRAAPLVPVPGTSSPNNSLLLGAKPVEVVSMGC